MTYESVEESEYSGNPIELYKFDREGISFWTYTSADTDQTYGGKTYEAIPIARSDIEQSQDLAKAGIQLSMPTDTDFLDQFIATSPTDVINLTVHRFHSGDAETVTTWIGRVINVEFNGYEATVHCESSYTSLARPMGRRLYQVNCPHVLYGTACGVSEATYKTTAVGITISSLTISHPDFGTFADGYFNGGEMRFTSGGLTTRRLILSHVSTAITINMVLTGAENGSTVDVYPGCGHNTSDCFTKFSNIANYGGQPYYPDQNPFSAGSLVW